MTFRAPYLPYSKIREKVNTFLSTYHPTNEIPIPVEQIIEFQLNMDIVPFPNLYRDHGLSGYLDVGQHAIWIDQCQMEQYERKYRYT